MDFTLANILTLEVYIELYNNKKGYLQTLTGQIRAGEDRDVLKLILADINAELVGEWTRVFHGVSNVMIHHGSIFDAEGDALVSPANSYGYMDGGLDLALSEFLGWHVQDRLQERIKTVHHGELLVGVAEIVPTDHPKFPYLISAPTMRVPTALGRVTPNPYLAMRAVLILVKFGRLPNEAAISDVVKTVIVPGLGTGVGQIPASVCANQMFQAVNDVLFDGYQFPGSWYAALQRQQLLSS
jgi:O-acetyl-ADP-ribose deacetylase (regulator of RNase III)